MKNIDKVRRMSVEELAEILMCPHEGRKGIPLKGCCDSKCLGCVINWLKQEADEE